jgi:hypothetical protein
MRAYIIYKHEDYCDAKMVEVVFTLKRARARLKECEAELAQWMIRDSCDDPEDFEGESNEDILNYYDVSLDYEKVTVGGNGEFPKALYQ